MAQGAPTIDPYLFQQQYAAFQKFVNDASGTELTTFAAHPYIDKEEGYKYRVHPTARAALNVLSWSLSQIGTGRIRDAVIAAIELQENNLVSWKPRYGEDSKAHRILLEAENDPQLCRRVEASLLRLYTQEKDAEVFAELVDIFGKRYSLIAYLFFLKDRTRYLPIAPEHFDTSFELLGANFKTSGKCSWENYSIYLDLLRQVRDLLAEQIDAEVAILDAHSFCWMLSAQMAKAKATASIEEYQSDSPEDRARKSRKIVYFNNCHNREHRRLFGEDAFFDLDVTGRQATQARDLLQGQLCVVVERAGGEQLSFGWYSLDCERSMKDRESPPEIQLKRVFCGEVAHTETLSKADAAQLPRYIPFFRTNGHLKIGSVFRATVLAEDLPPAVLTLSADSKRSGEQGGGFGDPIQNKLVEIEAMDFVTAKYVAEGWNVKDVTQPPRGYDLLCTKGCETREVEVKGVSGSEQSFIITAGEVRQAQRSRDFVLAVVTAALSDAHQLTRYSGEEFFEKFELAPLQHLATLKKNY